MSVIDVGATDRLSAVGRSDGAPTNEIEHNGAMGTWTVDPAASSFGFQAGRRFGLGVLRGHFPDATGTFTMDTDGIHGVLRLDAQSVLADHPWRDRRFFSRALRSPRHHSIEVTIEKGVLHPTGVLSLSGTVQFGDTVAPLRCRARLSDLDPLAGRATTDVEVFMSKFSLVRQRGLPLKEFILGQARVELIRTAVASLGADTSIRLDADASAA